MPVEATHDTQSRSVTDSPNRRLDIQGLRAVAVLLVVLYHADLPIPGGFVGVDMFFVISGFVITTMLMREWNAAGRLNLRRFYLRRYKRLAPALALTMATTLILAGVFLSPIGPQQTTAATALGALALVANVVITRTTGGYFDAPADTNALLNTWSLSVEEQFYLVFPTVLACAWFLAKSPRKWRAAPFIIVTLIVVGSFALAVIGASSGVGPRTDWLMGFYGAGARAWEFACGSLLALALTGVRTLVDRPRMPAIAGIVGAILIFISAWAINDETPFPSWWTLVPVLGTLLLLTAGLAPPQGVTRILSARPLVFLGDVSYSLYLWHWPLIAVAIAIWPEQEGVLPLVALFSLAPAVLSYYLLEQPVRRATIAGRRQVVKLVLLTTLPPALLAIGLWTFAANGYWSTNMATFYESVAPEHAGVLAGCDKSVPMGPNVSQACMWGTERSGAPIYLVGDSNADHFSEAAIGAGQRLNRPVTISTSQGCPFLPRELQFDNLRIDRCSDYFSSSIENLETMKPGLVIIAMANYWWASDTLMASIGPQNIGKDRVATETIAARLTSTVRRLQESGQQVLLIQTVPEWQYPTIFDPSRCNVWSLINNSCHQSMPRDWGLDRQRVQRDAILLTAAETGAGVLDTWDTLCPTKTCSTQGEGFVRYHDRSHITVDQSEEFVPVFAQAIEALVTRPDPAESPRYHR